MKNQKHHLTNNLFNELNKTKTKKTIGVYSFGSGPWPIKIVNNKVVSGKFFHDTQALLKEALSKRKYSVVPKDDADFVLIIEFISYASNCLN